jgi:site-specific DNA-methyltransferase (adenine-specific)
MDDETDRRWSWIVGCPHDLAVQLQNGGTEVSESFLNGRVTLHSGDCLDVLAGMEENSIDAVVTDPPYHLVSIVKRFGNEKANNRDSQTGRNGPFTRASAGFMGQKWDGGDIAFQPALWAKVLRVIKPGGHLVSFGASRGYHRMACAIEDAGFEIRDSLMWIFGGGLPKSQNVARFIDRELGVEGSFGEAKTKAHQHFIDSGKCSTESKHEGWVRPWMKDPEAVANSGRQYIPASEQAIEFDGFGTGLKPAFEPIVLARKPLSEDTVAANVLRWRTGALNIWACRVASSESTARTQRGNHNATSFSITSDCVTGGNEGGRWPANLVTDGSAEVLAGFPHTGPASAAIRNNGDFKSVSKGFDRAHQTKGHADSGGSVARFFYQVKRDEQCHSTKYCANRMFYTPKADWDDRIGSKHPTIKPVDLMQYLVRLVTPPKGTVLDPFAGTGTTGEAAFREGFNAVIIEREAEYQQDIRRRMAMAMAGPDERSRESIKARGKTASPGPLFE